MSSVKVNDHLAIVGQEEVDIHGCRINNCAHNNIYLGSFVPLFPLTLMNIVVTGTEWNNNCSMFLRGYSISSAIISILLLVICLVGLRYSNFHSYQKTTFKIYSTLRSILFLLQIGVSAFGIYSFTRFDIETCKGNILPYSALVYLIIHLILIFVGLVYLIVISICCFCQCCYCSEIPPAGEK